MRDATARGATYHLITAHRSVIDNSSTNRRALRGRPHSFSIMYDIFSSRMHSGNAILYLVYYSFVRNTITKYMHVTHLYMYIFICLRRIPECGQTVSRDRDCLRVVNVIIILLFERAITENRNARETCFFSSKI